MNSPLPLWRICCFPRNLVSLPAPTLHCLGCISWFLSVCHQAATSRARCIPRNVTHNTLESQCTANRLLPCLCSPLCGHQVSGWHLPAPVAFHTDRASASAQVRAVRHTGQWVKRMGAFEWFIDQQLFLALSANQKRIGSSACMSSVLPRTM